MTGSGVPPDREPPGPAVRTLFVSHDGGLFGAQRMLLALVQGLDPARVQAVLAASRGSPLSAAAAATVEVVDAGRLQHWLPTLAHLGRHDRLRYALGVLRHLPASVRHMRHLIRSQRIQVVYSNTVTIVEAALAARLEGVPHIWHIHEPVTGNAELAPICPHALYLRAIRALSARVVLPAAVLTHDYGFLNDRLMVAHNGIRVPAAPDRARLRAQLLQHLALSGPAHLVGVVGSFNPRKDHETFLRMAAAVRATVPDAHFLIVGTGSTDRGAALKAQAQTLGLGASAHFHGPWPGDISELLGGLDVLVISSLQESFGLTSVEAMAMETPVVSTRCGGPEEIIEDGVTGYLVEPRDHGALAQRVAGLLQARDRAAAMGVSGRSAVLRKFTEAVYVEKISTLIQRVAAQAR